MEDVDNRTKSDALGDSAEGWKFLTSMRGLYIMGQALQMAIKELESVPYPLKQSSNISDMKFIRDHCCGPLGQITHVDTGYVKGLAEKIETLNNEGGN